MVGGSCAVVAALFLHVQVGAALALPRIGSAPPGMTLMNTQIDPPRPPRADRLLLCWVIGCERT